MSCNYLFKAPSRDDQIAFEFNSFTIDRVTLCAENIRIFDAPIADPYKMVNMHCDTNKPMVSDYGFWTQGIERQMEALRRRKHRVLYHRLLLCLGT